MFKIPLPRVKSLLHIHTDILCTLYTGEVYIYTLSTINTCKEPHTKLSIVDLPIRTSTLTPNFIVLGADNGKLYILSREYKKISEINTHIDIIRKVVYMDNTLASCSDDTSIKIYNTTNTAIIPLDSMVGHKHYVMDITFINGKTLASCSIDATVKIWNIETRTIVSTLSYHTDCINTIEYINNILYTAGDDHRIVEWEYKKAKKNRTYENITNNEIYKIYNDNNNIWIGTENELLRLKDNKIQSIINNTSRIWDILNINRNIILATDEGIKIKIEETEEIIKINNNKIYVAMDDNLFCYKIKDKGDDNIKDKITKRDIKVESGIKYMKISPNGRIIALIYQNKCIILSSIGLRIIRVIECNNIEFIDNDNIYIIDKGYLINTNINESVRSKVLNVNNVLNIIVINRSIIVVLEHSIIFYTQGYYKYKTMVKGKDYNGTFISIINYNSKSNQSNDNKINQSNDSKSNQSNDNKSNQSDNNYINQSNDSKSNQSDNNYINQSNDDLLLITNKEIIIIKNNYNIIESLEEQNIEVEVEESIKSIKIIEGDIEEGLLYKDIIIINSRGVLYYYIIYSDINIHRGIIQHNFNGRICGILEDRLYYLCNKEIRNIELKDNNMNYENYILNDKRERVECINRSNGIKFLVFYKMYDKALELCVSPADKIAILLSMGNIDESVRIARDNNIFNKRMVKRIVEEYNRREEYAKSMEVLESMGENSSAKIIGFLLDKEKEGRTFVDEYRKGRYTECASILVGTGYEHIFYKFYN